MKIKGLDQEVVDHKDILFDILSANNVQKKFTVSFDGSGDSGQVEDVELPQEICNLKVEGIKKDPSVYYDPSTPEELSVTVENLIENVCYGVLECVCGGWEIDSGSYGTFTFDVKNRKVHLDFNERIEDVNNHEYEF